MSPYFIIESNTRQYITKKDPCLHFLHNRFFFITGECLIYIMNKKKLYKSLYLSLSLCHSLSLSNFVLSINLSVCRSIYIYIVVCLSYDRISFPFFINPLLSMFTYLFIYFSLYLSIYLSMYLFICIHVLIFLDFPLFIHTTYIST